MFIPKLCRMTEWVCCAFWNAYGLSRGNKMEWIEVKWHVSSLAFWKSGKRQPCLIEDGYNAL
jgi:hypothetical protein